MKIHHHYAFGFLCCVISSLYGCTTQPSNPNQAEPSHPDAAILPSPAAGMVVHIDPATGRFLPEPAPNSEALKIPNEFQKSMSTSSDGLTEEKSPIPGGGYFMDLQGRYKSPLIATQAPDGEIQTRHLPPQTLPENNQKQ